MAIDLNAYGNCTTNRLGSGLGNCDSIDLDDINGIILFNKGWSKDITDGQVDFDLTAYKNDVKALSVFPYVGIYDFTQDTPDNENATSSSGVLSEVRVGKPQFGFNYDKGTCLHKSLWDKRAPNGGVWDYGLITNTHIILAVSSDGTKLKAFDGGLFSVSSFKFKQGSDPQSSMATIQLLDANEFNARITPIPFTKAGDLDMVQGAVETSITVDAIADTDTEFSFSVVSNCNKDSVILDLADENNYVLLGTQASATTISGVAYNASTGKYVATVSPALASGDTVQIKLSDGTYDVIEDTAGNMYKGISNSVTVS